MMGLVLSMTILVCTISFIQALEEEILRGLDSVNHTLRIVSNTPRTNVEDTEYPLNKVKELLPSTLTSSIVYNTSGTASLIKGEKYNNFVSILGVDDNFFDFVDVSMKRGTNTGLLSNNYSGTPKCIIDSKAYESITRNITSHPNSMYIADSPCQIVGVYQPDYNLPKIPNTYTVITNVQTVKQHLEGVTKPPSPILLIQSKTNNSKAIETLKDIIGALGFKNTLVIDSAEALISLKKKISTSISLIVYSFISVFLLISCFSVAGVKVIEVSDIEGEIGLKLALGAKKIHILKEVILSSVIFTLFAGTVGILIGALLTHFVISPILLSSHLLEVGVIKLNISVILISLSLLTLVSFIASYLPSKRALSIEPSITMRRI